MEFMSSESKTSSKCFGWDKLKIAKAVIMAFGIIFFASLIWYQISRNNNLNEKLMEQKELFKAFIHNHGNHFRNLTEGISDLQEEKRLSDKIEVIESRFKEALASTEKRIGQNEKGINELDKKLDERNDQLDQVDAEIKKLTKPLIFSAFCGDQCKGIKSWITFGKSYFGGGFDIHTGTYTVPEAGYYIFGLQANSGTGNNNTKINMYLNNRSYTTVAYDGNGMGNYNNLGTSWNAPLKKGDVIRLKVESGDLDSYLYWWGFRIFEF